MGKVGRFACILTPMLLTLASLVCVIIVMTGQMPLRGNNAPSTALGRDLYFFKADTSGFTADPDNFLDKLPDSVNIDNNILNALKGAASSKDLKDFYKVGLWSYCEGDKAKDGTETITYCSARKFSFYFNPSEVWQLKDTNLEKLMGDDYQKGMNTYKKVAGWMNWAFVITLTLTCVEFIIGFFGIFSRWGSVITTFVSSVQALFAIAAAATATGIYVTLVGVFETMLKDYNIEATLGRQMQGALWITVAFSIGSALFWLLSACCCSGRSAHNNKKGSGEKTPYTYERVSSPAFGQKPQHQHTSYAGSNSHSAMPTAYEPFRHQQNV